MFNHILVVCTGNICRSPVAEALLRKRLKGDAGVVASAGTAALVGEGVAPLTMDVAAAHGVDLSAHHARQLTMPMLAGNDLVLVMEAAHAEWIHARYPQFRGRVQPLGRWREAEVADPYGGPRGLYEEAWGLIEACVEDWAPRLGSEKDPGAPT